jgi:hypothetical protein
MIVIIAPKLREPHEDSFGQERPMVTLIVPEKAGRNAAVSAATVVRTQRPAPKRGRKSLWMLAGLAVALCLARTTPAWTRTTVTRTPIDFIDFVCPVFPEENGELVTGTGQGVTVTTVTDPPGGGYQYHSEYQYHGTAVGHTTGTHFTFNQAGTFGFGTNSTTVTHTQVSIYSLISQGSAPNQRGQSTIHLTIDSNGNVAVSFEFQSVPCQ